MVPQCRAKLRQPLADERNENNCFTEMCSGPEAGSYFRLTDFVYHLTLSLRVITKKRNGMGVVREDSRCPLLDHG